MLVLDSNCLMCHFRNSPPPLFVCKSSWPSPSLGRWSPDKKYKQELRQLTQDDSDLMRKLMASFEKHLKMINQLQWGIENELKQVKEVVKRDPALRIFVKRIGMNIPLDTIKVTLNKIKLFFP